LSCPTLLRPVLTRIGDSELGLTRPALGADYYLTSLTSVMHREDGAVVARLSCTAISVFTVTQTRKKALCGEYCFRISGEGKSELLDGLNVDPRGSGLLFISIFHVYKGPTLV
jgi:hypothetical protein